MSGPVSTASAGGDVARLWNQKCGSCHGKDGAAQTKKGQKMKVKDMTTAAWQKEVTDARIIKSMTDGITQTVDGVKQKMKAYKKLTPEQMQELVAYIRGFNK